MITKEYANLAQGALNAGIGSWAGILPLATGYGALFPSVFPYKVKVEQFNTSLLVTKREICTVTGKSVDNLNVTRAVEPCPGAYNATTQTQVAYTFDVTGGNVVIVTLIQTAGDLEEMKDEINAKLDLAGGIMTGLVQWAKSINIASAGTTNLATLTGNFAHVTGTTTITAFGTVTAGTQICLVFDWVLTLTHNATSLKLPTNANIVTQAGDRAIFESEGSGNWTCLSYLRNDGTALTSSGDDFVLTNKIGFLWNTLVAEMMPTSTSAMIGWTNTSMTFTRQAGWVCSVTSSLANTALSTALPGTGATEWWSASGSKDLVVSWTHRISVTTGRTGWGLQQTDTAIHDIQTGTFNWARFIQNGGTLYTHTSNGTTQTNNTIGGITLTNYNVYRIVVDPGVDVKFYVNGTLVATHTTNLPTGAQNLVYGSNNPSTVCHMLPPIISRQI